MFNMLLTAAAETSAESFNYMHEVGLPFGKTILILFIALAIVFTLFGICEAVKQKRAGARAKGEPGSGFRAAAGMASLIKVLLTIVFFPFFIIWAAVRRQ